MQGPGCDGGEDRAGDGVRADDDSLGHGEGLGGSAADGVEAAAQEEEKVPSRAAGAGESSEPSPQPSQDAAPAAAAAAATADAGPLGRRLCRVPSCSADVSHAKSFNRRYRICETHRSAPSVVVDGQRQRFCQMCAKFHEISEFEGAPRPRDAPSPFR